MAKKKQLEFDAYKKEFPGIEKIKELNDKHKALIHASNILKKVEDCVKEKGPCGKVDKLNLLIPKYLQYVNEQLLIKLKTIECFCKSTTGSYPDIVNESIAKRVKLLNDYYEFFEVNKIEGKGGFDSRSKIRSTILEEFMYFLFKDYVDLLNKDSNIKSGILQNGSVDAYSNLYFTAPNLKDFVKSPTIEFNTKDQDYAIYRTVDISIKNERTSVKTANIPILAIENKTFLDKTMLEGAIATAEKIKMGAPYAIYVVATETYAVKYEVDPVYSRIDQIFVLRKCKHNKNNRLPKIIDVEVVQSMFWYIIERLQRPWAEIEKKLTTFGTII